MASQMALEMRTPADSVAGSLGRRMSRAHDMSGHAMPMMGALSNAFEIPYGFPKRGHYRIWVQVKRHGVVQTGVFDADVGPVAAAS